MKLVAALLSAGFVPHGSGVRSSQGGGFQRSIRAGTNREQAPAKKDGEYCIKEQQDISTSPSAGPSAGRQDQDAIQNHSREDNSHPALVEVRGSSSSGESAASAENETNSAEAETGSRQEMMMNPRLARPGHTHVNYGGRHAAQSETVNSTARGPGGGRG
ncbi:unnamed protein product, partial [Amoebophrya sp. A120]|eukprot:GSA120T00010524001.1